MSERVTRFNHIVDNAPSTDTREVLLQVARQTTFLLEEVKETKDAALIHDWVEVLDGVADIMYVAAYLRDLLESVGCDVTGAFNAVCDNNDEKFTTSLELANEWKKEKEDVGVATYIANVEYEGVVYYTVRRISDLKVIKYNDFPKVDLLPFIPEGLIEND